MLDNQPKIADNEDLIIPLFFLFFLVKRLTEWGEVSENKQMARSSSVLEKNVESAVRDMWLKGASRAMDSNLLHL